MIRREILSLTALLALALASPAWAKTDSEFLSDAIKGDNSEIALGNLALQMGSQSAVKSFGQTLVTDHTKAKADAVAVAAELGVTPPTDLTDEAKAELIKLKGLSGTSFDQEFANYMVKDHKKDISDFKDEAKSGGKTVSALAKKTIPALEKHLKIAESLAGKG
jgi:putative membrane protein